MIRSMTGHGAASCEHEGMHLAVELRSVNNRSFKAMLRLPDSLGSLEGELESWLARRIGRGTVSLTVRIGDGTSRSAGRINSESVWLSSSSLSPWQMSNLLERRLKSLGVFDRHL